MSSRMERYYKFNENSKKRSQKNQDLYRNIYDLGEYSNIEGIAEIDKNNEVDITKIKKMLKNREEYSRQKEYRKLIPKSEQEEVKQTEEFTLEDDDRSYDITKILNKAKSENEEDNKYLRLDNTNYNILKELKIKNEVSEEDDENLKDMINTITNTSMLNKLGDKELSLKLLEDFEGETKLKLNNTNTTTTLDKSFYTAGMKLKKEDFEDGFYHKKNNKILKIIIFIVIIIAIIVGIYFGIKIIK